MYVDDEPLASGFREASPFVTGPDYPLHAVVDLEAGQVISVRVEYSTSVAISIPGTPVQPHLELGWRQPDDRLAQAAALAGEMRCSAGTRRAPYGGSDGRRQPDPAGHARRADIRCRGSESPHHRRDTWSRGPSSCRGWMTCRLVIHAWFPVNSSRLRSPSCWSGALSLAVDFRSHFRPTSRQHRFRNLTSTPVWTASRPIQRSCSLGTAGISSGAIAPAFPFGHGLGYTAFEFADLRAEVTEALIGVTFSVRNVGSRRGKAVPQLYVTFPPVRASRPAS